RGELHGVGLDADARVARARALAFGVVRLLPADVVLLQFFERGLRGGEDLVGLWRVRAAREALQVPANVIARFDARGDFAFHRVDREPRLIVASIGGGRRRLLDLGGRRDRRLR